MMAGQSRRSLLGLIALACLLGLAPAARAAMTETEVWRGTYRCAQGLTGLTLTLLLQPGGQVQGLFEFYPLGTNPAVATGCFEMSGTLDDGRRLTLAPGAWRRQPPGYVTVGLAGQEVDAERMIGTVAGPGCTGFTLARQTAPGAPSACASATS